MKRKPSRRRCGKRQYPDQRSAENERRRLQDVPTFNYRPTLHAYRCPYCNVWHLGNREDSK